MLLEQNRQLIKQNDALSQKQEQILELLKSNVQSSGSSRIAIEGIMRLPAESMEELNDWEQELSDDGHYRYVVRQF